MRAIDKTHDPALRSWVAGSEPGSEFPIQNLPFGRYRSDRVREPRVGVAIGDFILDFQELTRGNVLSRDLRDALASCAPGELKGLMAQPSEIVRRLRGALSEALAQDSSSRPAVESCLVPRGTARMMVPTDPRNYTDFFASIHHAKNAGQIRRPGNPLLPNFHHIPVAYHGRASTIKPSGTDVLRPHGQMVKSEGALPVFDASDRLDFECEVAVWVGQGNDLGKPIKLADAAEHVFGIGLLNDWSARDIQMWETQPLGPFLSKNFLTTVSPWIVTMDALAPFRVPAAARGEGVPGVLPYLNSETDRAEGGIDLRLSVRLSTRKMRERGESPAVLSTPNFKDHYWTISQMVTHHTVSGCQLMEGDVLGTGTVSGPTSAELGCMLELNLCGKEGIKLPNGESRMWLADGDELILSGRCEREGYVSIGLGEARGTVIPAEPY